MRKLSNVVFLAACAVVLSALPAMAGIPCTPVQTIQSAPEPATLALLAVGIGAVALIRRTRTCK